ncbi:MAG TPA: HD domain-containing protein [Bacillota bacterium]|nr:HD domain-containing protein [Bacillota bacterium]
MSHKLSSLFNEAFQYAARIHAEQPRKGSGIPYISHLMAVSALVIEHGGNENEAIAALLHDAVEDQGGVARLDEIRTQFGAEVAEIVAGCTDAWTEPKPAWQKRKEEYIQHLEKVTPSVLLVSAADKLHNARAILSDYREVGERLWERFTGGKNGTMWYYRAMLAAYRKVGANRRLVEELERVVRELELLVN